MGGYLLALLLVLVGAAGIASAAVTRRRIPGQSQTFLLLISVLVILIGFALACLVHGLLELP